MYKIVNLKYIILQYEHQNVLIKLWLLRLKNQQISEQKVAPMSPQQTGAKKSVWKRKDDKWASGHILYVCQAGANEMQMMSELTVEVQALAKVMYLGLNWRLLMGPGCFPSSTATFIPLSVLQTWTLPSSEPAQQDFF